MGTKLEIVVADVDAPLIAGAIARVAALERRWSRFLADSEISTINRHPSVPVLVSHETMALVWAAVDGWLATAGRFDPTVLDALCALGYDRTFDEISALPPPRPTPSPGAAGVEIDEILCTVTVPPGVRLDLGGIGKGAAADIVSGELIAAGAGGAAVSLGGDVRVRGSSPTGGGWTVTVGDRSLPAIDDGGVCTSTTTQRRWGDLVGAEHHHIVDPFTGWPTGPALQAATVVGATAQQAEVLTKACLVAGEDAEELLRPFGVLALLTDASGQTHLVGESATAAR